MAATPSAVVRVPPPSTVVSVEWMRPVREWGVVRWIADHPIVIDVALTAAAIVIALISHFNQQDIEYYADSEPRWWTATLVAASALPLLWRRTHAIVCASIVIVASVAFELVSINSGWVAPLVALYALGAYSSGRRRSLAAGAIFFIVAALLIVGFVDDEVEITLFEIVALFAYLGVGFVVGDNIRRRREELRSFAVRAETAEHERELLAAQRVAQERSRIARDLHDIVAHSVSVMVVQASAARRNLDRDRDITTDLLSNIETTGRQTMGELRQILGVLRNHRDAAPTEPLVGDIDSLASSIPDLDVTLHRAGELDDLPLGVGVSVYRLVQEALTNAHRHAGPGAVVEIDIERSAEALTVLVSDDGRGASARFDSAASEGYGLIGMSERIDAFGGTLKAGPRRSGGWEVRATFPLQGSAPADVSS